MKKGILLICSFLVVNIALSQITVDGTATDWSGTASGTAHATTTSSGEWIYTGESSDERTDYDGSQESSDNDITEIRFTKDGTYLYILIKMRDITNVDYPHICLVFTNGSSSQSFIGDDSAADNTNGGSATALGNVNQHGRLVDIHATSTGNPAIEMYDGGSWYSPPSADAQVSFSTTNDVIEARINLSDLGLTSSSTSRISVMATPNRLTGNGSGDGTAWSNNGQTNGVDVMTPGGLAGTNAWVRDLSDNNVGNSASVDFSTLPVELTKFNTTSRTSDILLSWETASEINNSHFEIEKSTNGNDFEFIGTVEGNGSTTELQSYNFIDENPVNGLNYYRLKQVDYDGTFEYSDVSVVEFKAGKLATIYPNPARDELFIQTKTTNQINIFIYNLQGQLVRQMNNIRLDGQYRLNLSDLTSGLYQVQLFDTNSNAILQQHRMIKQ